MEVLKELKSFYFLGRGEFFQVFQEELQPMMLYPPTRFVKSDLNGRILPNTLIQLGWLEKRVYKKLSFEIQSDGFEYPDFVSLAGLIASGNVVQKVNLIRFEAASRRASKEARGGCVWHSCK